MSHTGGQGFRRLVKVDDALRIFLSAVGNRPVKVENVTIQRALGRILAKEILAKEPVPFVDRSTLDGYAVRSEDTQNSSAENPVSFQVVGESKLGEACRLYVRAGTAVTVATGSVIPAGANAVAMVESVSTLLGDRIAITRAFAPGHGITKRGEDVGSGAVVIRKGKRLRPQDLGIIRAIGYTRVVVARRPRLAVISTGSELVRSIREKGVAKVVDINGPVLSSMLQEVGCIPVDLGIVNDEAPPIRRKLLEGLSRADVVIISAGSSVGKKDLVPKCISDLGKPGVLVHGVAMRPAMPTGLAVVKGKPILSLPGFPVSAIFSFYVFGRPLIFRLTGECEAVDPTVRAILKGEVSGQLGYRTFVRVNVTRASSGFVAAPLPMQSSSVLMSMVAANGFVTIPEDVGTLEEGREVEVSITGAITHS